MAEETIVAICQYGGTFNSEVDGTKYYTGGEAHAVDINRKMTLQEFKSEISDMFKIDISTISLKYFRNKRVLIAVRSDKDLEKMVDLNIDSGTVDVYILSEADNRTKAADSGAVVAETAASVDSQRSSDTINISKRETSSTVPPSIEAIKPGDGGAGAEHKTRKTRKRLPKSSVSPSIEGMDPVEVGAGANAIPSTGKTRKRLPKSRVSSSVEAMNPSSSVEAMNPEAMNPEAMIPEVMNPEAMNPEAMNPEVMNPVEVGAGVSAAQSTRKTRKRLPKSSVSPLVEVMNPVDVGADANAGQSTRKTRKRLPKSSISPSVEAMIPVEVGADAKSGQNTEKRVTRSSVSASVDAMKTANEGVGAEAGRSSRKTSERVIRSTASPSFEAMRHGDGGDDDDARQIKAAKLIRDAGNLLGTENLAGIKKLVLEALEYDPLVEGADQVIAVADVLLAAQRRINNQIDWYAVLQLDPATSGNNGDTLRLHYRRLTLLLRTSSLPRATDALRIVADAYDVLSDSSKKYLFDAWSELTVASADLRSGPAPLESPAPPAAAAAAPDQPFWTTCPSCFHVYQYDRAHEGHCLLCQNCRRAFLATALTAEPSIVPGTEMYYCSWGCFPIGFPNGVNSRFTSMPRSRSPTNAGHLVGSLSKIGGYKGDAMESQRTASPKKPPPARKRKVTSPLPAKKRKTASPDKPPPASPDKPPPARKRRVSAKKTTENNSRERVLVVEPEARADEANMLVVEAVAKSSEANMLVVDAKGKSSETNVLVVDAEAKTREANTLVVDAEAETREANTLVVDAETKNEDANVLTVEADAMSDMFGVEVEDKSEEANMLVVGADGKNEEVKEAEANGEEVKELVVSEDARPVAGGSEESDGAAAGKKAAPVVLDLNEEAGFLETHDTGLMMDHYDDIVGFDLDLDAVDLDAAGDLLGNLNLSNGFHVQHHP